MRALVSTDLHSSPDAARAITAVLDRETFDVHLCLGDIITFRPLEFLEDLLSDPPIRTHTVPGNTDSAEARERLRQLGLDIHFRAVEVGDVTVAGAGGCPPPPFRTAFVVEEDEYARRLPPVLEGADVLASHAPARGLLDKVMFAVHVGSEAVWEAVASARPRVVLSGHIHEADGMLVWDWSEGRVVEEARLTRRKRVATLEADLEGRTLFMNPGPAKVGLLGTLELEGSRVRASTLLA
jgi:Icc-related predicted phosphoesterase